MKNILDEYPNLAEFMPFLDLLNKESPRGQVLISSSYLENLLGEILLSFLVDSKSTDKLLNGFNAPLGTFSSRIEAAHSSGLITLREYQELDLIRKIRNEFAHNLKANFESEKIKSFCIQLSYSAEDYGDVRVNPTGKFVTAATALILNLVNLYPVSTSWTDSASLLR